MVIEMNHPSVKGVSIKLIANPLKMEEGTITYRRPPPQHGEHTKDILKEYLKLSDEEIKSYKDNGTI